MFYIYILLLALVAVFLIQQQAPMQVWAIAAGIAVVGYLALMIFKIISWLVILVVAVVIGFVILRMVLQ